MNLYQERLMEAPSNNASHDGVPICCVCGMRADARHHVVYRSQGGTKGPTVPVCGRGNESGCHGEIHAHRIFLDYRDGMWVNCYVPPWEWEEAGVPIGRRTFESIPDGVRWYACLDGEC